MDKPLKKMIRINTILRGYIAGTMIPIAVDAEGTPMDRYWRDRFKDAKRDRCVEFVTLNVPTKPIETKPPGKGAGKTKEVSRDARI